MRCYICDNQTDYVDNRDGKPVCESCLECVAEVLNEWYEDDTMKKGNTSEDTPNMPRMRAR